MPLCAEAGTIAALEAAGAELLHVPGHGPGEVAIEPMLQLLGKRGFNDVLLEAGPALNGAFMNDGFIDELIVYQSGCVLGDTAAGMIGLEPLDDMAGRPEFVLKEARRTGADLRTRWLPVRES